MKAMHITCAQGATTGAKIETREHETYGLVFDIFCDAHGKKKGGTASTAVAAAGVATSAAAALGVATSAAAAAAAAASASTKKRKASEIVLDGGATPGKPAPARYFRNRQACLFAF